ncbi:myosin-15 [Trifolium repens]|nr:myosin-15 [Trifolium repens]
MAAKSCRIGQTLSRYIKEATRGCAFNVVTKGSLDALEKKSTALELELVNAQKDHSETIQKMKEFEQKSSQLAHNLKSPEEKLLSLEKENHVLCQKVLSVSPKSNRSDFAKSSLEVRFLLHIDILL